MDYRVIIDQELEKHFQHNSRVEVCTLHDDFAIVYVDGQPLQRNYHEDFNISAFIEDIKHVLKTASKTKRNRKPSHVKN